MVNRVGSDNRNADASLAVVRDLRSIAGMTTYKRALVPEDRNGGHRPARFLQRAFYSHAIAAAERREKGPTTPHEAAAVA
jgi:hypothetical protein